MPNDPYECPNHAALDALSRGATLAPEVHAHVARCPACAKYLDAARFENRFAAVMSDAPLSQSAVVPIPAPAAEGMPPRDTPRLPGYRITDELARGGQGIVFRGVQIASNQRVAIKVLHPARSEAPSVRARFSREIQIAGALNHPGIVRLLDSMTLPDGRAALIMEYVDGQTLSDWLACRPDQSKVINLLANVAEALHHAHQRGVIHRDLKPSNILVDATNSPRVLDFGVACWTESQQVRIDLVASRIVRITQTGEFAGTLAYAAPEQLSHVASTPDIRSDVYSLGVIGYEAILGRLPYSVEGSLETIVENILHKEPARPTRGIMNHDLWTVLSKAMSKEPNRRYQTAVDFARDLRSAASGEAIDARRNSSWYVVRKSIRRYRYLVALGVIAACSTLAFLTILAASNVKLATALHQSTIERLRTLAATGSRSKAEAILWSELDGPLAAASDPKRSLWQGTFAQRQALWAFLELQGAATCLASATFQNGPPMTITPITGGRLGMVNFDGSLDILSPDSLQLQRILAAPGFGGQTAYFMPSGDQIVVLRDDAIECFQLSTTLSTARHPIPALPKGRLLRISERAAAICSADGQLDVFSLPALKPIFSTPDAFPSQLVWLDQPGRWLGFIDNAGALKLVDLSGELPAISRPFLPQDLLARPSGSPLYPAVLVTPDRSRAALATQVGVFTLNLSSQDPARPLPRGPGYRVSISMSPDGQLLTTGAFGDSRVRIWSTDSWEELEGLPGHEGSTPHHAVLPGGKQILTVDRSAILRLWAAPNHGWKRPLGPPAAAAQDLALSVDASRLFASGPDGKLSSRSTDPDQSPTLTSLDAGALTVVHHPSLDQLASSDGSDTLSIFREARLPPKTLRPVPNERIAGIRYNREGDRLALATAEGTIAILDAQSGATLDSVSWPGGRAAREGISSMRWSPASGWIAVCSRNGQIAMFPPGPLQEPRITPASTVQLRCVEFTPDGLSLAAVGDSGQLINIDVRSGRVRSAIRISEDTLFAVAYHPGGQSLATADRAGNVVILDAATAQRLAAFNAGAPVAAILFDPTGDALFVAPLGKAPERWDFAMLAGTLPLVRPATRPSLGSPALGTPATPNQPR
jgi:eukaryotic-like serine/threonine-protein kinase